MEAHMRNSTCLRPQTLKRRPFGDMMAQWTGKFRNRDVQHNAAHGEAVY